MYGLQQGTKLMVSKKAMLCLQPSVDPLIYLVKKAANSVIRH